MIRAGIRIPTILVAGLLAASCSSFAIPTEQPDQRALAERKAKAEKLTRRDALAAALVEWRVLESISRGDPSIAEQRRAVENRMKRQAKRHFEKGRKAANKGQTSRARREFLAALAIDPSHEGAIKQLRAMELKLVRKNRPKITTPSPQPASAKAAEKPTPAKKKPVVAAKVVEVAEANDKTAAQITSKSLRQAMGLAEKGAFLESIPYFNEHLVTHPEDAEAKRWLASSHREVGITYYNNGKLKEAVRHLEASAGRAQASDNVVEMALADAKRRIAQDAYEKGIKAFSQDVGKAISFWEEALKYNPAHLRAKSYLEKAYKIYRNWEKLNFLVQQ